ncbi:hypothetical protein BTA51_05990 [Hahella sp. CCB-MM4]|uniref:radical SAM protein n=1 Tax=Hahella sp. (strain CCB-MM4) TaxID=1926491 RepID=UPI000B9B22F7|nr:radical SAM protein [Hahella sp. CCB-MM4]OZG74546.1 hypothetical protein BTA51_05990 [Hahella sp. CCB-MM4]
MPDKIQIEITTRCNFDCFYCAGRHMPQKDMPLDLAYSIIDKHVRPGMEVNLQGEGEPVLAKHFWSIVQRVHEKGGLPYIITNAGYTITPQMAENFIQYFNKVHVSLDTTDPERAEKTGRHNIHRVMDNILKFGDLLGKENVGIVIVSIGRKDIESVINFATRNGIKNVSAQSLQTKDDYMIKYKLDYKEDYHLKCPYLERDIMRYFNVEGIELPCCFIKDTTQYVSAQKLREQMHKGIVPQSCKGCRFIRNQETKKVIVRTS